MKELLLEIGTEEIPAGFVPQALSDLKELVQKEFEANRIDFKGIQTLGTPRRIILHIESVSERQRDEEMADAGVVAGRIAVDPGFRFGRSVQHNFTLLRELSGLESLGCPEIAGLTRKSMLGAVTGRTIDHRLAASVAAALLAVDRGARIVRVHDVAATRDALQIWAATREGGKA